MRYFEVFNEVDCEHEPTPQQYVEEYDAIVEAVRNVVPDMKFLALALSYPEGGPHMFEYFLDPKNHKSGIPLDYISFHVNADPSADQTLDHWQYTFFGRANISIPSDSASSISAVCQQSGAVVSCLRILHRYKRLTILSPDLVDSADVRSRQ